MTKRTALVVSCVMALGLVACGRRAHNAENFGAGFVTGYEVGRASGPSESGQLARCRATGATVEQCCENHPDARVCEE